MTDVMLTLSNRQDMDPRDVVFIDSIAFEFDPATSDTVILLRTRALARKGKTSWPDHAGEFDVVWLRFRGVRDVTLDGWRSLPLQVTGFDVMDVSDRYMEGLKFEVLDYENARLHWFAREVDASADPPA